MRQPFHASTHCRLSALLHNISTSKCYTEQLFCTRLVNCFAAAGKAIHHRRPTTSHICRTIMLHSPSPDSRRVWEDEEYVCRLLLLLLMVPVPRLKVCDGNLVVGSVAWHENVIQHTTRYIWYSGAKTSESIFMVLSNFLSCVMPQHCALDAAATTTAALVPTIYAERRQASKRVR